MKDSEVREKANELAIDYLTRRIEKLEAKTPEIRDCPKCKHPVLAVRGYGGHAWNWEDAPYTLAQDYYQCLTCGVRFSCENKSVCEILKEKR